jgi:alpha-beta hydrolase superfamily lysophospholipase/thiol-disulfide isomerase/thioredoxin
MQIWREEGITPCAVLLCIHGLSLHANSFTSFGKAMAHVGIPTYALDVRGFGSWQNSEEATHLSFDRAFNDIKNTLRAIRRSNPGLPLVIVGESMGGAIALQTTAANPDLVDGLICCVPSRRNSGQNTTNMKAAIGLLYRPNALIDVGDSVIKRATQQSDVAEEWENDPMTRKNFNSKELLQFRNLMNNSRVKAEQITKTPVLFLQGGSDRLIKPTGTVDLFNRLKTSDKDLVMVGTAQHLILEQGQFDDKQVIKDDVIAILTNWIDKHVANADGAGGSTASAGKTMEETSDQTRKARGHFKIAEGEMLLNDPEGAADHLVAVIKLARGTALAQKADQMLLTLPEHLIAPPIGATKHDNAQLVSLNAAKANDKPSILVFCAPWIEACKTILADLHTALGPDEDKVNIVWIDADKQETQGILDEYGVKPLPALLYLSYKNEVLRYSLGNPGLAVLRSRVRLLLDADAKLQQEDREKAAAGTAATTAPDTAATAAATAAATTTAP